MADMGFLSALCLVLLYFNGAAEASGGGGARTFTVVNKCREAVWVGTQGSVVLGGGGWEVEAGGAMSIEAPAGWHGRFWGRTGCQFNGQGHGRCQTGDCGGLAQCAGLGGQPPATLAEFSLGTPDFYDISLVDGYNMELRVEAHGDRTATGGACLPASCDLDVNALCPTPLRVQAASDDGAVVACRSACNAFAQPRLCCTGSYANPQTCRASPFSRIFKRACPHAYSFAFDDPSSTFTCSAPRSYLITFCR